MMSKKIFRNEQSRAWSMTQEKVASMKRRCEYNDYTDRGIYMITIAIEGRKPLLGVLTGRAEVTDGPEQPNVVLSPLGEKVKECWMDIPKYHPEIEIMKLCVMPDHIHGVIFVHERMACHLGMVIKGFKTGTHKAARELGVIKTATMSQCTETRKEGREGASVSYTATMLPLSSCSPQKQSTLWERGYHDRLLRHEGQLSRMFAYLDDNPRRLLLKRDHSIFFKPLGKVNVAGISMDAMGNLDLLSAPVKLQVQCSRHLYPNEIEQKKQYILEAGKEGAVMVSPCISPGERQITTACLEHKIPLIVLLLKGFPPFFKPSPRYLIACAEGRLLLLSPFPWQNERLENMRARCLELNEIAASIVNK